MNEINVLLALMIIAAFVLAIALHEYGHALAAAFLGDTTPRSEGRQTLSIRSHLDAIGTLFCVLLAFQPILFPMGFGWGKPVKPDPWKMRVGANAGVLIVAWAGPIFSLIIGLVVALLTRFIAPYLGDNWFSLHLLQFLVVFASVNICLTLFNLLPIYPLDGYQILYTLLPSRQAVQFAKSAPYGLFIILLLFFFLPFLGRLANIGDFPLFQLAYYIWLGSVSLISVLFGNFPLVLALYGMR